MNLVADLRSLREGDFVSPNLRLVQPLRAGGMGNVWLAEHLGLRTQVVVKFMADHLSADEVAIARFKREAAAASQVRSPHVVQMIDRGVSTDGRLFIAMELLDGFDLATLLAQRRKLEPETVLAIVTQVARALSKAHEKGIVHRDIKPENIFLIDSGGGELFVKVLDFGVAKSLLSVASRGTTASGIVGTPQYMAPEQILEARASGPSSDLWALGIVAFEALTGTVPFTGPTVGAVAVAICHHRIPVPSEHGALPKAVDAWFLRACNRDPELRFGSALEMADALRAALEAKVETKLPTTKVADPDATARRVAIAPPSRQWTWLAVLALGAILGITLGMTLFRVLHQ